MRGKPEAQPELAPVEGRGSHARSTLASTFLFLSGDRTQNRDDVVEGHLRLTARLKQRPDALDDRLRCTRRPRGDSGTRRSPGHYKPVTLEGTVRLRRRCLSHLEVARRLTHRGKPLAITEDTGPDGASEQFREVLGRLRTRGSQRVTADATPAAVAVVRGLAARSVSTAIRRASATPAPWSTYPVKFMGSESALNPPSMRIRG